MKYVLAFLAGSATYAYGKMVFENHKALKEYDSAMTDLFNSIPAENRYGYEKDFAPGTRWSP